MDNIFLPFVHRSESTPIKNEKEKEEKFIINIKENYLPEIVSFSLFQASSINTPKELNSVRFPQWKTPKWKEMEIATKTDQSELPLPSKHKNIRKKHKLPIHKFQRKMKPNFLSLPKIEIIKPFETKAKIRSNAIKFKDPEYVKVLRPSYSDKKTNFENKSCITIPNPKEEVDIKTPISSMFHSILQSNKPLEDDDTDFTFYNPLTYSSQSSKLKIDVMPSLLKSSIFDDEISEFEYNKITKRNLKIHKYIPKNSSETAPKIYVKKGKQRAQCNNKFLYKKSELSISSGEYVIIETTDEFPIIQPMVGMSSQLDVIICEDHPCGMHYYDPRIPLTHLLPTGIQPFLEPIPKNTFVLMYSNSVMNSALAPHESHPSYFILTFGKSVKIHKFPKVTYLSTNFECKVIIPKPIRKDPLYYLKSFLRYPMPPPEQLCKNRSIYNGIQYLNSHGISRFQVPTLSPITIKQINSLPNELRVLIYSYIRILKNVPWNRSKLYERGRIGYYQGQSQTKKSINHIREELTRSFTDKLWYIHAKKETDLNDLDLETLLNEEEEELEILLDTKDRNEIELNKRADLHKTRINWKEIGLNDFPKRPLMKIIETKMEDGKVISTIHWERDPTLIKNAKKRAALSRMYYEEEKRILCDK